MAAETVLAHHAADGVALIAWAIAHAEVFAALVMLAHSADVIPSSPVPPPLTRTATQYRPGEDDHGPGAANGPGHSPGAIAPRGTYAHVMHSRLGVFSGQ